MSDGKRMQYVSVTARDGQQSLCAKRMTNMMILSVARQTDTFVVTQAMRNVMHGQRSIPGEVRRHVLGHYIRVIGEGAPEVSGADIRRRRASSEPFTGRPGDEFALGLPRLRGDQDRFDNYDDLLVTARYSEAELGGLRDGRAAGMPGDAPRDTGPVRQ